MPTPNKAKVSVSLTITTTIDIPDDGYLGTEASVAQHIQKVKNDVRNWTVYLQRGSTEPKVISAQFKVNSVTIIPEDA